jgi:hypothetical protein
MGTFTKSFGSCGGYIAADKQVGWRELVLPVLPRLALAHVGMWRVMHVCGVGGRAGQVAVVHCGRCACI